MCKFEDELVNHTIDANRATDKLEISICRIVEDEVVPVKGRQIAPSHATSQLFKTVSRHLIDLRESNLQSEHDLRMVPAP